MPVVTAAILLCSSAGAGDIAVAVAAPSAAPGCSTAVCSAWTLGRHASNLSVNLFSSSSGTVVRRVATRCAASLTCCQQKSWVGYSFRQFSSRRPVCTSHAICLMHKMCTFRFGKSVPLAAAGHCLFRGTQLNLFRQGLTPRCLSCDMADDQLLLTHTKISSLVEHLDVYILQISLRTLLSFG